MKPSLSGRALTRVFVIDFPDQTLNSESRVLCLPCLLPFLSARLRYPEELGSGRIMQQQTELQNQLVKLPALPREFCLSFVDPFACFHAGRLWYRITNRQWGTLTWLFDGWTDENVISCRSQAIIN